jgi:hypothetical protein
MNACLVLLPGFGPQCSLLSRTAIALWQRPTLGAVPDAALQNNILPPPNLRDIFSLEIAFLLRMIFSEYRFPLFGIMR